jgi:putative SOS response-associated peptidase YedK
MSDFFITIFIAPPEIAKVIHGRYVCLVRQNEKERWFTDDSLVSLSVELSEYALDWPFIERALVENNAWQS